jgi:uncharacterized protein YcbX
VAGGAGSTSVMNIGFFVRCHSRSAAATRRRRNNADPESEDKLRAFWEDRLFGPANTYTVRFRIGDVNFEGSNPCARCSMPPRDSRTGTNLPDFQKRFCDLRSEQLQPWASAEHFDHFYRLATNTHVALAEAGKILRVGDPLELAR